MAQQIINIGTAANDGTGDTLREASRKARDNFSELYAIKQIVDTKDSVRVASTANIAIATALINGSVIDGITVATGDRVLLKNQTLPAENGIYVVVATGAASRSVDANTLELVTSGLYTFVSEGTVNLDTGFVLTTNDPIVLGATSLNFTQYLSGYELLSNKKTDVETNKTSNTFYPSIKSIVDWIVARFSPISGSANYIQASPASAQSANIWVSGSGTFGSRVNVPNDFVSSNGWQSNGTTFTTATGIYNGVFGLAGDIIAFANAGFESMRIKSNREVVCASSVQVGDNTAVASALNVGAMRYRVLTNVGYPEIATQNGVGVFNWNTLLHNNNFSTYAAPAIGSANYIQNQSASAQTASQWLTGIIKTNGTLEGGKVHSNGAIITSGALAALSPSMIFFDQPLPTLSRIGFTGNSPSVKGSLSYSHYSSDGSLGGDIFFISPNGNMVFGGNFEISTNKVQVIGSGYFTSSVQVGDNTAVASALNVGAIRYRETANASYSDKVMKVSATTYAWVNLVTNTWI